MLSACLIFWHNLAAMWWKAGFWWLFVLPPVAFTLMILAGVFYMKNCEEKNLAKRHYALYCALKEIQSIIGEETGLVLNPGPYSAWIEILRPQFLGKKTPN